ncbi:MAG: chromosomal replication initiator protein DnaA [Acidobacteriaceae bacterium]|nr:chromosomal replication initiator protein DnaA [Acidobacteriaceae bacterium]
MSFVPATAAVLNHWVRILGALEKKINRQSYETWLKPTRFSHLEDRKLFVRVPSKDFQHIGDRYADLIQEAIENLGLEIDSVTFTAPVAAEAEQAKSRRELREDGGFAPVPSHSQNAPRQHRHGSLMRGVPSSPSPEQSRFDWNVASNLNPRYQFDSFVVGNGNQFASAAAQAVAERPSKAYNPLFLYGGVGMGKTHLMHAIGHDVKRRQPHASICYVSGEKFTNEMIDSVRYQKMTSFRDRFRNVDVLLIDDIQFLAGKERTQEEFFHTFNALHESTKQIVIASDRPPKELQEFEDRLRSRFEWGLMVDIQPPDLETKVAILQKKAESEQTRLPSDVAMFIASNVRTNVRELEGALVRLIAWCSMQGVEISLPVAQSCLRQFIDTQVRKITIEAIQRATAEQFGMRVPELKQKNNSRQIVVPRQIAMYLCKQLTEASLPEIGRQFGGKHHTTVMHSIAKIDEQRRADKDLNSTLNKLMETLS